MARIFALCLLVLSSAASAADWWYIGTWGNGSDAFTVYADNESAQTDGKRLVQVWVYTRRAAPADGGEVSARALTLFDCTARTWTLLTRISEGSDGRHLATANIPERERQTQPVAPDTMADDMLKVACGAEQPIARGIIDPVAHSRPLLGAADPEAPAQGDSEFSYGTGFFIGPSGHVLTSYHVIENGNEIACRTPAGAIHDARLVRASPTNDLALLQVNFRPARFLGFAPPGSVREGDRVFTMGFPAPTMLGPEPRFTDGSVSALSVAGENSFLQTSIPIQPGNSGGPVITETGRVVGIVAATAAIEPFYRNTGTLPQNVNWAVKAEYASPLLAPMAPAPIRSREEAIALARDSICLIISAR